MPTRAALLLRLLLVLGAARAAAAAGPAGWSDGDIQAAYLRRCESLLAEATTVDTRDLSRGGLVTVAACLQRRSNVAWANARLARLDAGRPAGDMFWMYPMVTAMEAGQGAMDNTNRARIRELWRSYFPYRGDTENHWLLYYASLCLAAEANPGAGPEAWCNGKSSAENIAEARSYRGLDRDHHPIWAGRVQLAQLHRGVRGAARPPGRMGGRPGAAAEGPDDARLCLLRLRR